MLRLGKTLPNFLKDAVKVFWIWFTFSWLKASIRFMDMSSTVTMFRKSWSCSQRGLEKTSKDIFTANLGVALLHPSSPSCPSEVSWSALPAAGVSHYSLSKSLSTVQAMIYFLGCPVLKGNQLKWPEIRVLNLALTLGSSVATQFTFILSFFLFLTYLLYLELKVTLGQNQHKHMYETLYIQGMIRGAHISAEARSLEQGGILPCRFQREQGLADTLISNLQ